MTLAMSCRPVSHMGSLRQRGDGVWQARVYAGLDPVSGKQRYTVATIHAKSEAMAERELRKLGKKVHRGPDPVRQPRRAVSQAGSDSGAIRE